MKDNVKKGSKGIAGRSTRPIHQNCETTSDGQALERGNLLHWEKTTSVSMLKIEGLPPALYAGTGDQQLAPAPEVRNDEGPNLF